MNNQEITQANNLRCPLQDLPAHLDWIYSFGDMLSKLADLPKLKLQHFAAHAAALNAGELNESGNFFLYLRHTRCTKRGVSLNRNLTSILEKKKTPFNFN